jgi:diguanylate cyclase (GGDEF)-like protein
MQPLDDGIYQALLTDLLLAAALLALFVYVAGLSRGMRGVAAWGVAHFAYTTGATLLDAIAPIVAEADHPRLAAGLLHGGVMLACAGMAGLAVAVIGFVRQRPPRWWEQGLVPAGAALPLAVWISGGGRDAQTVALTIVELGAFLLMGWHLLSLRSRPERVPARLMVACCAILAVLYASVVPGWPRGQFGYSEIWVSVDVSIWFMLNFCMLMLASFRAAEGLRRSAMVDPLTGALNRRGIEDALRSRNRPLALEGAPDAAISLDIDRFKAINDRYGHAAGDDTLRRLAETVRGQLRTDDLFERAGGDEFTVLLRCAGTGQAQEVAERIRAAVKARAMHAHAAPGDVTVSVGVHVDAAARPERLVRGADAALYRAKQQGRDRVVVLEAAADPAAPGD